MGYRWVKVRAFVDEGESPDQGLPPMSPGRPDQGLPGGGYYPDQGLPGGPNYPSQGLPPYIWGGPGSLPGGGYYPDQGLPGGGGDHRPDQGLPPMGQPKLPSVQDLDPQPTDPPDGNGQYALGVYHDVATWVWVPRTSSPEVEPPEGTETPGQLPS
jgi:hypothetical protein